MNHSRPEIYSDGTYLALNPTWHAEDSLWKARQILEMIRRNDLTPGTICEIGCGSGDVLQQLQKFMNDGILFTGYDISPQAMDMCRPKATDRLKYELKDVLAEQDKCSDLVLVIDVLEHVEDYRGFLRKVKDRGVHKIFHIPLNISVQTVWRNYPIMEVRKRVGHIHYFTKDTALATLEDTGHTILDCVYTHGAIELPARGWRDKLLRVPRRVLFRMHQELCVRLLGGYSLLVLTA